MSCSNLLGEILENREGKPFYTTVTCPLKRLYENSILFAILISGTEFLIQLFLIYSIYLQPHTTAGQRIKRTLLYRDHSRGTRNLGGITKCSLVSSFPVDKLCYPSTDRVRDLATMHVTIVLRSGGRSPPSTTPDSAEMCIYDAGFWHGDWGSFQNAQVALRPVGAKLVSYCTPVTPQICVPCQIQRSDLRTYKVDSSVSVLGPIDHQRWYQ